MNITVGQVFRCAAAAVLLSALTSLAAPAQRFNISTNLMEYANLGTLNLDVSYGVAHYAEQRKHINTFCGTGNNPELEKQLPEHIFTAYDGLSVGCV